MHKKIIFRCDSGKIPELGTGHLQRCITLSILFKKKFGLKKNDILFLTKTNGKFNIGKKILTQKKINFVSINNKIIDYSRQEKNLINSYNSKLIVIDRLGKINKSFIYNLKKNHKKILLFDDNSKYRDLVDLAINPLILNVKKLKKTLVGFKFNIIPAFLANHTKKIKNQKINNIFISFGGYDKNNLTLKLLNHLKKNKLSFGLVLNEKYKSVFNRTKNNNIGNKIRFFNSKNYYKKLMSSDLVICAGGLTMFDAIFFNKKIISIPQYKHQLRNINILNNKKIIYKLSIKNMNKINYLIKNIFEERINQVNKNNIISSSLINKTLKSIYKLYE